MNRIIFVLLLLASGLTHAANGMLTTASSHEVNSTMDRLEQAVVAAGFKVIARVNHGAAAKSVDIELPPVQLLIFGKPKAGSLLMQSNPQVGIDLPMKYLVWKDTEGVVKIGWNDPQWLAARHEIADREKVVGKMSAALEKFAAQAAQD